MTRRLSRILTRLFSTAMVATFLLIPLSAPMVSAQGPTVYVPDLSLQDNGGSVQVRLNSFNDLGSADFRLVFNPSIAQVVSIQTGNLPGGTYAPTNFDNSAGWAFCGWATSADTGPSGNYILCTVTFAPLATGGPAAFNTDAGYYDFRTTGGADIAPTSDLGDLSVLAPTEVWVDDDWECSEPAAAGDTVTVNGTDLVIGYNAFCNIQDGIDAIEAGTGENGGTVHVLDGDYTEDLTISENNIRLLGEDGAVVAGGCLINADNATGIVVDNLVFYGTVRVACNDTNDVTLSNLEVIGSATNGIEIVTNIPNATVYIENPVIHGCTNGIYVENDSAVITNPDIYDCQTGIYAGTNSIVTVSNGSITNSTTSGIHALDSEVTVSGTDIGPTTGDGIYVDGVAQVTVNNCASIHDSDYGIYVNGEHASLVANGNNLYNNNVGVYWTYHASYDDETDEPLNCEENWWGDEVGPVVGVSSLPPRDSATLGIDYSPWLDARCPGGDPVGISAKLKGVARTGEPGLKVTFTDLSSPAPGCEIIEWLWDFGDGSTSIEQNPSHTYMREGSFTIKLTVWDSCDFSNSVTMKAYITIAKVSKEEAIEEARLGVSYLNIDPAQVLPNQEVVISANICNSGEERGSKTVSLLVNGSAEQSQSIAVSGGACQQVVFKTSRAVPGTYQVAIDGMTGQFSVLAPRTVTNNVPSQQQTGLGTAGIIAIIAVVVVLIAALIMVFRKD